MTPLELTDRQSEAWTLLEDKTHTEILFGGAAGGAKSFLGCAWLIAMCCKYKGSRWLMGRAVLKTLKETTLNTFFEVAAMGGLHSGRDYVYNQQAGTITIGPSAILLKDLFAYPSDPNFDDLGSLEITGAFVDEVNQITEKARDILKSRIRYKLTHYCSSCSEAGLSNGKIAEMDEQGRPVKWICGSCGEVDGGIMPKFLMSCNPAKNWVYRDYYQPWRNGTLEPYRAFIPGLVGDNPHISPHYIDSLKKLKGADRERLLNGNWDYDEAEWQLLSTETIYGLWTFDEEKVRRGKPALTWDVAGPGSDRSVAMIWDGFVVTHIHELDSEDVNKQARQVEYFAKIHKVPRNRMVVDATGIGTGPAQQLRGCVAFEGGASPRVNKDFKNFKAECAFKLAEVANEGWMGIATDTGREQLQEELPWIRQYKGETDMKVQITPKKDVRQALGRSPDYADNFIMRMALEVVPSTSMFEKSIDMAQRRTLHENRERWLDDLQEKYR